MMIAASSSTAARAEMGSYVAVRVDSSNGITLRASKPRYSCTRTKCIQTRKIEIRTLNPKSNLYGKNPSISCLIIQLQHHWLCCRPAPLSCTPFDAAASDADDGVASASSWREDILCIFITCPFGCRGADLSLYLAFKLVSGKQSSRSAASS